MMISDARVYNRMREKRMAHQQYLLELLEITNTAECPSYGVLIDDTIRKILKMD